MRNIKVREVEAKSALNRSGLPELDYALNPYLGCLHGCRYCYAADMTPGDSPETWGSMVAVRKNIVDILKKEVKTKRRGIVGISTITDPYQAIEGKYRLTEKCVDILTFNGFRVSIQTKSPLVLRDMNLFRKRKKLIDIGMSIATPYTDVSKIIDRDSPVPSSRMRALGILADSGLQTWMYLGPIIPGVNDSKESIYDLMEFAAGHGIRVIYDTISMYPGSEKMLSTVMNMASSPYRVSKSWWNSVEDTVKQFSLDLGVRCNSQKEEANAVASLSYRQLL